jgi:hypothetical protein
MKKDVKERWIKALRSGKYKQTTGRLRTHEGGWCCLGVLCDVFDNTRWTDKLIYRSREDSGDDRCGSIPEDAIRAIQFPDAQQYVLQQMNDIKRNTFDEIADYVEENL